MSTATKTAAKPSGARPKTPSAPNKPNKGPQTLAGAFKNNPPKDKTIKLPTVPGAGPTATTNTPKDNKIKAAPIPGVGSKGTTLRAAFPDINPSKPSHGGGTVPTATHGPTSPPTGGGKVHTPETKPGGSTKAPPKLDSDPKKPVKPEPKTHPSPETKKGTKVPGATDHAPAPASGPSSKTSDHEPLKPGTQHPEDKAATKDTSKGKTAGGAPPIKPTRPKNPSTGVSPNQRKLRLPPPPEPKVTPKTSSFLGSLTKAYGAKLTGMAKGMVKDAATSIAQDVSKQAVAVASEYAVELQKKVTKTITNAANEQLTGINHALGLGNIQIGGTPGVPGGGTINPSQTIPEVLEDAPPPSDTAEGGATSGNENADEAKVDESVPPPADAALGGTGIGDESADEAKVDESVPPPADAAPGGTGVGNESADGAGGDINEPLPDAGQEENREVTDAPPLDDAQ